MKKETINIGILGLGTVGQGVLKILQENREFIEQGIYPYKISVKKITDKNKDGSNYPLMDNHNTFKHHCSTKHSIETPSCTNCNSSHLSYCYDSNITKT